MNTVLQSRADSSAGSRQRACSSKQIKTSPTRVAVFDLSKVYKRNRRFVKQQEGA